MNLLGIYYKWLLPTRAELLLEHLRGNIIWSTNGCAHLLRITAASCQSLTHKVKVPKPFSWLSKLFLLPVPLRGVTGFWLAIGTEWQHVNVVWRFGVRLRTQSLIELRRRSGNSCMEASQGRDESLQQPYYQKNPKEVFFTSPIYPTMVLGCLFGSFRSFLICNPLTGSYFKTSKHFSGLVIQFFGICETETSRVHSRAPKSMSFTGVWSTALQFERRM